MIKPIFSWITFLVLVLGIAMPAAPQQPGRMHGGGMMGGGKMGGGMMGGRGMMGQKPASSRAVGGAASTYARLCASCHGAQGKGDGPAAAALQPRPKDFTDCKVMAHASDNDLFKIIKEGGQSSGHSPMMPPWGGTLTDEQIHEMVSYVRSFCKK